MEEGVGELEERKAGEEREGAGQGNGRGGRPKGEKRRLMWVSESGKGFEGREALGRRRRREGKGVMGEGGEQKDAGGRGMRRKVIDQEGAVGDV